MRSTPSSPLLLGPRVAELDMVLSMGQIEQFDIQTVKTNDL